MGTDAGAVRGDMMSMRQEARRPAERTRKVGEGDVRRRVRRLFR
jgi:hypothetical protein